MKNLLKKRAHFRHLRRRRKSSSSAVAVGVEFGGGGGGGGCEVRRRRYGRTRRRHRLGRIDLVNWAQTNYTSGPTLSAHIKPFVSGSHRTIGLDSTRLKKRKAGETQKKKKRRNPSSPEHRRRRGLRFPGIPTAGPVRSCGVVHGGFAMAASSPASSGKAASDSSAPAVAVANGNGTTPQKLPPASAFDMPKPNLRGLNKPKCIQCGNVARSR